MQSWFTQTGRDLALAQGWYIHHRVVQQVFVIALAIGGLVCGIWLYRVLRDFGSELRWAALGLEFPAVFVIIRAASFHHIDELLHTDFQGMRLSWILELGGIAFIAAAAAIRLRRLHLNTRP